MSLTNDDLKTLIRTLRAARPEQVGCRECFEKLDRFAEEVLAGKSPARAMPLIQEHLNRCGSCREEFEALMDALVVHR